MLRDADGRPQAEYILARRGHMWGGYVPGVGPGQIYSYRLDGPWDPDNGIDQFARRTEVGDPAGLAFWGLDRHGEGLYTYTVGTDGKHYPNPVDGGGWSQPTVVIDRRFDWGDHSAPEVPLPETVICEMFVPGATARLDGNVPDAVMAEIPGFSGCRGGIPAEMRGTYAGLAHDLLLNFLVSMGITDLDLMPAMQGATERVLAQLGLENVWNYQTKGYRAPEGRYAMALTPQGRVNEFKTMVRRVNARGIEVILDTVYGHTPDGFQWDYTYGLRAIDNWAYYHWKDGRYLDVTGCGNTVNLRDPEIVRFFVASLRYWVQEMKVNGFRLDQASVALRLGDWTAAWAPLVAAIMSDPVLYNESVKFFHEPWDVGTYAQGMFAFGSEWASDPRDTLRLFWTGRGAVNRLATTMAGSSDRFSARGIGPLAVVNSVAVHDGLDMRGLTMFNSPDNSTNPAPFQGSFHQNLGDDHGFPGPTTDPVINAARRKTVRNWILSLMTAQGIPLITLVDLLGTTRGPNDNPFCLREPNEIDWAGADPDTIRFARRAIAFRHEHPVLRRRYYLRGWVPELGMWDCMWLRADGRQILDNEWGGEGNSRALGLWLNGAAIADVDATGRPVTDENLLILMHSGNAAIDWRLPSTLGDWEVAIDTDRPQEAPGVRWSTGGNTIHVAPRSMVVLRPRASGSPAAGS